MLRRLPAYLSLVCYSAIALCGQGLHEFLDDDGDHPAQPNIIAVASLQTTSSGESGAAVSISAPHDHAHDCDNCPICQFHAMGQHFTPAPAVDVGLVKCETVSDHSTESVYGPTLYSSAQPRAPPLV
jgi:hypothetical protein